MYTELEMFEALQMARLAYMDGDVFDFGDLKGLTEVCTYSLCEAYSNEEIVKIITDRQKSTL